MRFKKYHAIGNDYLVMEAHVLGNLLTPAVVRRICDRHVGVGADGILVQGPRDAQGRFTFRIWNPDGTEAEKSGNGLRIFACPLGCRGGTGGTVSRRDAWRSRDVPGHIAGEGGDRRDGPGPFYEPRHSGDGAPA